MKIFKKYPISAARSGEDDGKNNSTIFYTVTVAQALEALSKAKLSLFCLKELEDRGWRCIDVDKDFFGGYIDDSDVLYICVTDGEEIFVENQLVDPEYALEEFGVEACEAYIQPATDAIIKRYITEYEIYFEDIDQTAIKLLQEGYSFKELMRAAEDANIDPYE